MMIQIYGSPRSSAGRCFVMLEECGLSYEVMPLDMMAKREHKLEPFLKLNPNGKVPCMVDNGFALWESAAIVQYLAEKHKPELLGTNATEKALVQQWAFWTMTEAQPPMVDILVQKLFVPEGKKDLALIERREKQMPGILEVLEKSLTNKKFLVGDKYSVADLMAASAVNIATGLKLDMSMFPNIKAWFAEVKSRPAWVKVSQLRGEL
ncbi:glutathione S-transferase family protein [Bdellovibrio sp. HCB337]|uniref:glutathione S-transferase family protein n=1 Tax=Bdellovibrio sp. HCB337 TaxID=3394358 RepID=UPI0039A5CC79